MKSGELTKVLAKELMLPRTETARLLHALARVFQRTMASGEPLEIRAVGVFTRNVGAPLGCKSPLTGTPLTRPRNIITIRTPETF